MGVRCQPIFSRVLNAHEIQFLVACCFLAKFIHLIFYFARVGRSCLFIKIIFLVHYSAFTDMWGVFVFEVAYLKGKHGIFVEYFTPLLPSCRENTVTGCISHEVGSAKLHKLLCQKGAQDFVEGIGG